VSTTQKLAAATAPLLPQAERLVLGVMAQGAAAVAALPGSQPWRGRVSKSGRRRYFQGVLRACDFRVEIGAHTASD